MRSSETKRCCVDGCEKVEHIYNLRKRMCHKHYKRMRVYGDVNNSGGISRSKPGTKDYIHENTSLVTVRTPGDPTYKGLLGPCWIWNRSTNSAGYGYSRDSNKKHIYAHRLSYLLWIDPNLGSKLVLHKCDMPICVNPGHLYAGDRIDNARDAVNRNRYKDQRGDLAPNKKITMADAMQIRKKYSLGSYSSTELGAEYGISVSSILNIINNKTWRSLNA